MAHPGSSVSGYGDLSAFRSEGREPGARRKKIAGYLKAANELREHYFSNDPSKDQRVDGDDSVWADAAVVRHGHKEMIVFPSYAGKHIKRKPTFDPGGLQQTPGAGRDYRDTVGAGDAEFWKEEWQKYEDDNAIVDVDVRGWIYSPQRGPTTRKHRLMIGLARQLSGIPAPPAANSGPSSAAGSRVSSPTRRQDEEMVRMEAENIRQRGQEEAEIAKRGGYSEAGGRSMDTPTLRGRRENSPDQSRLHHRDNRQIRTESGGFSNNAPTPGIQPRSSWDVQPSSMSAAELHVANNHLLNRLKPFMANPLPNMPISAFFYNDTTSRQRTVYTDTSGHFILRAALDFVPTHVRILAGENLSATEEVIVTESQGVSLISDIDDTVKHSAITMGAREIFRTAFIRDLSDLTVAGVKEWYNRLHDMGVEIHYVSNSPWQMYPVLTSFFSIAGLPRGSFHLKQYSGMLQGIFEPVAERKRSNLERIFRDFPERKFILVGDSGEADLELYTEMAQEYPGKVIGVFIRDVTTTPPPSGYFDSSPGTGNGARHGTNRTRDRSRDSLAMSKRLSRPNDIRDDDADLQAAIAASLADVEDETRRARRSIDPDRVPDHERFYRADERNGRSGRFSNGLATLPNASQIDHVSAHDSDDLIDFSEDVAPVQRDASQLESRPSKRYYAQNREEHGPIERQLKPPEPPEKPKGLRSPSPNALARTTSDDSNSSITSKTPPPRPRKPSTAVKPGSLPAHAAHNNFPGQAHALPVKPSPLSTVQRQESVREPPSLPSRPKESLGRFGGSYHGDPYLHSRPPSSRTNTQLSSPAAPSSPAVAASQRAMSTANSGAADGPLRKSVTGRAPPPPLPRRKGTAPNFIPVPLPRMASAYNDRNDRSGAHDPWESAGFHTSASRPMSSPGSSRPGSDVGSPGEGSSRKEQMWQQRVDHARKILEKKGVTFRTWRVGSDVASICVKLVEMEQKELRHARDKKR